MAVGVIGDCWLEPVDCAPDQSLSVGEAAAVQAVASVVSQKSDADCPRVMEVGETVRETVGAVQLLDPSVIVFKTLPSLVALRVKIMPDVSQVGVSVCIVLATPLKLTAVAPVG